MEEFSPIEFQARKWIQHCAERYKKPPENQNEIFSSYGEFYSVAPMAMAYSIVFPNDAKHFFTIPQLEIVIVKKNKLGVYSIHHDPNDSEEYDGTCEAYNSIDPDTIEEVYPVNAEIICIVLYDGRTDYYTSALYQLGETDQTHYMDFAVSQNKWPTDVIRNITKYNDIDYQDYRFMWSLNGIIGKLNYTQVHEMVLDFSKTYGIDIYRDLR